MNPWLVCFDSISSTKLSFDRNMSGMTPQLIEFERNLSFSCEHVFQVRRTYVHETVTTTSISIFDFQREHCT